MNKDVIKVDTDFIIKAKSEYYEISKKIRQIGVQINKEKPELSDEIIQISKKLADYCITLEQIVDVYTNRKS